MAYIMLDSVEQGFEVDILKTAVGNPTYKDGSPRGYTIIGSFSTREIAEPILAFLNKEEEN